MTVHFTGCTHAAHKNIIKYCQRPFANADEMDKALVTEWNKVVTPNDTVYHLGDLTLGDRVTAQRYLSQLNGKIYILGNKFHHDKRWLPKIDSPVNALWSRDDMVTVLPPIHTMKVDDQFIVLCHYPFANGCWDRSHYKSICLHAHSHGNYQGEGKILDVGIDNVNKIWGVYRPVSLDEVVEFMEGR